MPAEGSGCALALAEQEQDGGSFRSLWSLALGYELSIFQQRWSVLKGLTAGDKAEHCPLLELRKLIFYLFYPLNSPVATLRLKFYILDVLSFYGPFR